MSQTRYAMNKDISRIAIEMVRGHDRRVKIYHELRGSILNGSACGYITYAVVRKKKNGEKKVEQRRQYFPRGSLISDPTADKALRLDALERLPETLRMKAVDDAKMHIGLDIVNEPERIKLVNAIWDSCMEGRNFNVLYRNLCVGKDNFYERRRKFLFEIAQKTGFI